MANIPSQPGRHSFSLPEVPRPSSRIWQPLASESIRWEGQVLIVGEEYDLPALLVTTRARVVLIANDDIALDITRDWLRPAPQLTAENGIRLFISPDEASATPEPILLRARDGRGAAAELVAVLTGRPLPLQTSNSSLQIPNWKAKVGASAPVALPPIEDDDVPAPGPARQSWPPVEQEGVAVPPQAWQQERSSPRRRGNLPAPGPVPTDISRSARMRGTDGDGFTISEEPEIEPRQAPTTQGRGHTIVAWTLRAAIFLMLLGTISYFGRDRLESGFYDMRDRLPANVQRTLGVADTEEPDDVAFKTAPETVDTSGGGEGDGTNGANTAQQPEPEPTETPVETEIAQVTSDGGSAQQTDSTANIGGPTSELPPTSNAEDLQDPTQPTNEDVPAVEEKPNVAPEPTEVPVEPTVIPTEVLVEPTEVPVEPTAVPTEAPTEVPTEEPTVVPTEVPTEEPTQVSTEEPTETPTEEPTIEPTPEPTKEPTAVPTEVPTGAPTEERTETPEPTLEPQAPSVEPETTPEQAVVADGIRYTVEGASVGETVPEMPDINSVGGYGEWVVLSMYGQNMSDEPQIFDMSAFTLYADGQEVLVDVGNAWVSGLLGDTPAYGNTDAVQWASGESHRFTLTFLAPPDAQTIILKADGETTDLSLALQDAAPLTNKSSPVESDLIQANVVDVIDGETIAIEIDGVQQTVRYLSVNAPRNDTCYAAEAADANRSLVAGETVTLERQSTNIDARGNWVRDVWVTNDAGQPILVSQQLVLEGAAEANISQPNTRFAGWLESSEVAAQEADVGMWGACGE